MSDNGGGSPQQVTLSGTKTSHGMSLAARSALSTVQTAAVPSPTGPSNVGTRVVQMVDPLRDNPFQGNGTKRELLVRFWYPASISEGCEPAAYTSQEVWSHVSQLARFPLPEVRKERSACSRFPGRSVAVMWRCSYQKHSARMLELFRKENKS